MLLRYVEAFIFLALSERKLGGDGSYGVLQAFRFGTEGGKNGRAQRTDGRTDRDRQTDRRRTDGRMDGDGRDGRTDGVERVRKSKRESEKREKAKEGQRKGKKQKEKKRKMKYRQKKHESKQTDKLASPGEDRPSVTS